MSSSNNNCSGLDSSGPSSHNLLQAYGWTDSQWAFFDSLDSGLSPGRVVAAHRTRWLVVSTQGLSTASIAGHFHEAAPVDRPVVGDWVLVDHVGQATGVILTVGERRGLLRRVSAGEQGEDQPIAANVDTVFIVGGLDGDFEHRRLRRYLALVRGCGAEPVIILNKVDLADDPNQAIAELAGIDPRVPIIPVSVTAGIGMLALERYLQPATTVALLGSSGVGKSTLINYLLGDQNIPTQTVREDDSKGRHTTTHRELFPHPSGAVIMDTPGMRELALSSEGSDLDVAFVDLVALAAECRFGDCRHENEPGCAVQAAIAAGHLPEERLADLRKLEREAMIDAERRHERHSRERDFGRMVKGAKKAKKKRGDWR